jgi:glutamate--cysteine ligase
MPARDREGRLAQTPHPEALGSALTHEQITTDYSESLLEFITPALPDPADTLASLDKIHRFAYSKLGNEYLWSPSMPCPLPAEEDIPIAYYGTSNIGQLKYVYRKGLALRYGKTMQCIAGIHYNFSLPEALAAAQSRRFRRHRPRLSVVGLHRADPQLPPLQLAADVPVRRLAGAGRRLPARPLAPVGTAGPDTLYLPYATSLRMSDLGYQSNAQAGLTPCYNDLAATPTACAKPWPRPTPYVEVGTHKDGSGFSSTPTSCRSKTSTTPTSAPNA